MINKKTIPYILLGVVIIFFLIREGCNQSSTNKLIKDVAEYKTEAKIYKGKDGVEVATNKSLILETQKQLEAVLGERDTLLKIMEKYGNNQNVTIINNNTTIRNDSIPYDTIRIPCDFKPFPVVRDTVDYKFYGTIAPKYFRIDSLKIPDTESIVFGKRKVGFLKRKEYSVDVVHSNKLIKTTDIGSYIVKPKTNKIVFSAGVTYGINLNTGKIQPMIGFHLGFPIISF